MCYNVTRRPSEIGVEYNETHLEIKREENIFFQHIFSGTHTHLHIEGLLFCANLSINTLIYQKNPKKSPTIMIIMIVLGGASKQSWFQWFSSRILTDCNLTFLLTQLMDIYRNTIILTVHSYIFTA